MTQHFNGKVEPAKNREYGKAEIQIKNDSKLFGDLPKEQIVWMSHGDLVVEAPAGFTVDATSASCPIASMSDKDGIYMLYNSIQRYVTPFMEMIY